MLSHTGRVIHMQTGSAMQLATDLPGLTRALTRPDAARFYHNHPSDAVPSLADTLAYHHIDVARAKKGIKPLQAFVYSHGWVGRRGTALIRGDQFDRGLAAGKVFVENYHDR